MVAAAVLFGLAAILGHDRYVSGEMGGAPFVLTLVAFATPVLGGRLGGSIVFVHDMRALDRPEEPTRAAVASVSTAGGQPAARS